MNSYFIAAAIISGAILLFFVLKSPKGIRSFILSAFQGLAALFAVNLSGIITGVSLAVNYWTAGVSAVLGLPGVICMLMMNFMFNR